MEIKPTIHITHGEIAIYMTEKFKNNPPKDHNEILKAIDDLFDRFKVIDKENLPTLYSLTDMNNKLIEAEKVIQFYADNGYSNAIKYFKNKDK